MLVNGLNSVFRSFIFLSSWHFLLVQTYVWDTKQPFANMHWLIKRETYLTSLFGLYSFLDVDEKQCDIAATANNDTPMTHSKQTKPTWTYGNMLNSRCNSVIRPGVSFSTAISNHTIGRTILSNGLTRLLNLVLSNNKLICKRECTLIGTPNCCE